MAPEPQLDPEERLDLLFRHLGTGRGGLSPREAARRLEQHGPNAIRRREGPGHLRELARQFTHPLAVLLWVAAALALVGELLPLAIAIVAVIVLNAVFAFAQELQAERATEALQEFLPPTARVRRGDAELEVDATTLVPGDLLLLSEGDRLPADARLIEGGLEVDMSPLTGESQPVVRSASAQGIELDLLLVGSRGYGPIRSALLGAISAAITRTAPCPVLVTPRSSGSAGSSALST